MDRIGQIKISEELPTTNKEHLESNIKDQQGKHKLKGLFDEMDNAKKKKGTNAKNNKITNQKNTKDKINIDIDPNKYKTKPTKPDFSQQFIEHSKFTGIGFSAPNNGQYKGLINFGNVCYSNVVMQCVIGLKEFVQMLSVIFKEIEDIDNVEYDYPILYNLVKIMTYYKIKNTSLASNHIKTIVNKFDSSGEQNDAHEFLVFIFDKLNDEILALSKSDKLQNKELKEKIDSTKKSEKDATEWEEVKKGGKRMKQSNTEESFQTSIIGNIFQGILKHEIEMKGKSLSKCNIEPFFVLSIDFGETSLESCFSKFFDRRKIESDSSTIFQKSYMDRLPKILILHLKAFYYDKNAKKIVKINKGIEYGEFLKISKEFISPSMQSCYNNFEYELVSVIIHKGTKANEGHYICFCKDENGNWWNLDDKKVFRIEINTLSSFRPYILFYRKIEIEK